MPLGNCRLLERLGRERARGDLHGLEAVPLGGAAEDEVARQADVRPGVSHALDLAMDQLQIALVEQKSSGKMLGEVLATMGLVPDEVLREVVANALGQQSVSMAQVVADPSAMAKVPKALAVRHSVFPLSFDAETRTLTLACARPNDIVAADQVRAQDQHSLAFGVSYQLSPTQKLKAEWMRVRIGRTSSLVDSPSGGDISHQNLNVFSMSYNFVF